jgi:hypothetical protein
MSHAPPRTIKRSFSIYEETPPHDTVEFFDDFTGNQVFDTTPGLGIHGVKMQPWVREIDGGPDTTGESMIFHFADLASGVLATRLTTFGGPEKCYVHQGDQLTWDPTKNLKMEFRARFDVNTTGQGEAFIGLFGDMVDTAPDAVLHSMFITRDSGQSSLTIEIDDNNTTVDYLTGILQAEGAWHTYMFDFSDITNLALWVDGVRIGPGVDSEAIAPFPWVPTSQNLQPAFGCYKSTGPGQTGMDVDWIRLTQDRE